MSHYVACLDVWAPAVREVVRRTAPPELDLHFATTYDEAEQMALVEGAEIILAGWAAVTAPMLAHAKRLRFIEKWGIGVDRIDVEAARKKGVPLAITAGSNAVPVAELTIGLILGVYRRLAQVDAALRRGVWLKAEMREIGYQIAGKTVGLVGFGNIGRKVAQRLRGFDCRVVYHDARRADEATETASGSDLRAARAAARRERHRQPACAAHAADREDDQRRLDRDDEGRRRAHQHRTRGAGGREGTVRRRSWPKSCVARGWTPSTRSRR